MKQVGGLVGARRSGRRAGIAGGLRRQEGVGPEGDGPADSVDAAGAVEDALAEAPLCPKCGNVMVVRTERRK